jgi:hypothetical protein
MAWSWVSIDANIFEYDWDNLLLPADSVGDQPFYIVGVAGVVGSYLHYGKCPPKKITACVDNRDGFGNDVERVLSGVTIDCLHVLMQRAHALLQANRALHTTLTNRLIENGVVRYEELGSVGRGRVLEES